MNQTKFRYLRGRVDRKIREETDKKIKEFQKKHPSPIPTKAVITFNEKVKEHNNFAYSETNKIRDEVREKWESLLDKAYLGEDKDILELLSN